MHVWRKWWRNCVSLSRDDVCFQGLMSMFMRRKRGSRAYAVTIAGATKEEKDWEEKTGQASCATLNLSTPYPRRSSVSCARCFTVPPAAAPPHRPWRQAWECKVVVDLPSLPVTFWSPCGQTIPPGGSATQSVTKKSQKWARLRQNFFALLCNSQLSNQPATFP